MSSGALLPTLLLLGCSSKPAQPANTANEKAAPSPAQGSQKEDREVPPELAAMLKEGPCEPKLELALEQHAMKPAEGSPARPKAFLIGPGEKLCLVGTASGDGLIDPELSPAPVALASAPQRLISVEFAMLKMGAVFVVKNHHDRPLTYRAVVKAPGHDPEVTSVCSVMPNLVGVEHWPNEIEGVMFGDFKLLEPAATPECK